MAIHPLLPGATLVVGRGEGVDIQIHEDAISRRHAIFHGGPPLEVEDLASANGTFVSRASKNAAVGGATADQNRARVDGRVGLGPGDTVFFGAALVVVRATTPPPKEAGTAPIVKEPAQKRVYDEATRAAKLTLPILILGETGVGKEVMARFV